MIIHLFPRLRATRNHRTTRAGFRALCVPILRVVCGLLLLPLAWVSHAADAAARETPLHIVMCEWVPYTASTLPNNGALAEVVRAALERQHIRPEFSIVPWQRAVSMLHRAEADALLPVFMSDGNLGQYLLSTPVLAVESVFASLKSTQIRYRTLADLADKHIGVVQNTSYLAALKQKGNFAVEEAPHETLNYQKLRAGRIDLMLDTRDTIERLRESLPPSERDAIVILSPPFHINTLHLAFRPDIEGRTLCEQFNRGFRAILADGTYESILDRHGMAHPFKKLSGR